MALARHATSIPTSSAGSARGGDRQRGIDRSIGVLELLLQRRQPMSPGDIARALAAPRSTVYEIVNRLVEAEMLEGTGRDGQVFFGRAMHLFGNAYLNSDSGLRRFGEALDALSTATGATVQCCTRRGDKYVVMDCRDGTGAFRITSEVGAEVPLPWTASGRVLLGHLAEDAILALIPPDDFRLPSGRILPPEQFLADVAQARQAGFFESTGLASSYTWCQAVPVFGRDGLASFTLCFVLPIDGDPAQRGRCLALLRDKARQLSHASANRPGLVEEARQRR